MFAYFSTSLYPLILFIHFLSICTSTCKICSHYLFFYSSLSTYIYLVLVTRYFLFLQEVSKHPSLIQDISFWISDISQYSSNDFYDLARSVGGELVEQVELLDEYVNSKTGKTSHMYRVTYRHMHRSLTTSEVNLVQQNLRDSVARYLNCEVRAK